MEYVKRLPESQSSAPQPHILVQQIASTPINNGTSSVVTSDPFHFEPYYSTTDDQGTAGTGYDGRHGVGVAMGRYIYKQTIIKHGSAINILLKLM